MTGRPETLEAALAWLAGQHDLWSIHLYFDPARNSGYCDAVWAVSGFKTSRNIPFTVNGDIPAAIVEAVGQVWDQIHGKDGAE